MKRNKFLWAFPLSALLILALLFGSVYYADPFFHFHAPRAGLYYELNESYQRSQNDGIVRNFDYEAIICGTSMTENFKASEAEELFSLKFIKTPFSGGSYKENKDNLRTALKAHPDIKLIIRGLDIGYFFSPKDTVRTDLGDYPTYLYDDSLLNDISYFFNRYAVFESFRMLIGALEGQPGGITDFDSYSHWNTDLPGGPENLLRGHEPFTAPETQRGISQQEREEIRDGARQNITDLARDYPDTEFYLFFTPYSAVFWGNLWEKGEVQRQLEAERIFIEEMLRWPNIKLFSFNTVPSLTTDLYNYADIYHYKESINSDMLRWMKEGRGLLTEDNYESYLQQEAQLYLNFDYNSLFG